MVKVWFVARLCTHGYCYSSKRRCKSICFIYLPHSFSVIYTGNFTEQSVSCCGMIISSDKGAIWHSYTNHTPPVSAQLCRGVEQRVNAAATNAASLLCAGRRSAGHMVGLQRGRKRQKAGNSARLQRQFMDVRGALRANDVQRS
jgi:hypothetical protein